jgi:predicted flavoprotein YhiN
MNREYLQKLIVAIATAQSFLNQLLEIEQRNFLSGKPKDVVRTLLPHLEKSLNNHYNRKNADGRSFSNTLSAASDLHNISIIIENALILEDNIMSLEDAEKQSFLLEFEKLKTKYKLN